MSKQGSPVSERMAICHLRLTTEGRWICLAVSLIPLDAAARFLVHADPLVYELAGVDEVARNYSLKTWQGGVISGARLAFRAAKAPIQ